MTKNIIMALLLAPTLAFAYDFTLASPDVAPHQNMSNKFFFKGFGCEGENVSPALMWKNAPDGTKSFAVTAYDPDAPTGSGWWHWVVFNIPANVASLPQGAGNPAAAKIPKDAVQSRTDFGKPGWGGPCPPAGDKPHHFTFTVFALKVDKLDLDPDSSAALVGFMINANALAKASFISETTRR